DVRRALIALSSSNNKMLSNLFSYRFQEGVGLTGHNFGNLLITALHRITDDFESAINEAGKILQIKGKVIPVTLDNSRLMAELENGQIIEGETNIDIPRHDGHLKIKRTWLSPSVKINNNAKKAILNADLIIIGPGDLYTSIIPNLLVGGVKEALQKTRAKKVYFTNLMTKFGETNDFKASDFISVIIDYFGSNMLDYAIINGSRPSPKRLASYIKEKAYFVEADLININNKFKITPIKTDLLRSRGYIRHDSDKINKVIKMII
ncbi:YvcK family protein, partial [Candidatus Wolfebacteria bacterium]|nr:YvcK family protein [Candidatus Wolfebacteria bacterium]